MSYFPTSVPTLLQLLTAKNNIAVTLDGGINDIITTIPVLDTSEIPDSGFLTFQDGSNECISYTGKTITSLTGCTRGADGTAAANHADGTAIGMWSNAEYHNRVTEELRGITQNLSDRIGLHATRIILQDYLDANSKKISNLAAATTNGDALRYEQLVGVYLPLGGGTMTGNIAFGGTYKLTGLAAGSGSGDSIRYEQVVGVYLPLAGGTMAGDIAFGGAYKLTGLAAGSSVGDSVRYEQAVLTSGVNAFAANQPMGGFILTGLGAGAVNGDSVRYEQVIGVYLPLAGGTMSGAVAMGGFKVTGLGAATANGDALRYEQLVGVYLPLAGGIATGDITMDNQTGIAFREQTGNGTNYVKLIAPDAVASNLILKLMAADGNDGDAIVTDGAGNLSFGPVAGDVTLYRESYIVGTASGNYTGSTTVFDMTGNYTTGNNSMMVFVDGVIQRLGALYDYVEIDANTITFNNALSSSQTVTLMWAVPSPIGDTTTNREDYIVGTASGSYTGSLTVFDLTQTYQLAAKTLQVYYDGVLMKLGASYDYVETDNNTVTFNSALTSTHAVSFVYTVPVSNSGIVSNGTGGEVAHYAVGGSTVTSTDKFRVGANGAKVKGTNTNDDADSGDVGQYVESLITTLTNVPTSAQYGDLTSISLPAGDWDVDMVVKFNINGATWSNCFGGIGLATGNDNTGITIKNSGEKSWANTSTAITVETITIPPYRLKLASTTTVYLKMFATYSAGTPQARGGISARRVR